MEAWRTWSRERLEREYSPSSMIDAIEPFVHAYAERSRSALDTLPVQRDIRYGPAPDELLDLVPGTPGGAHVVFFHGGYWQELGEADSLFPAPALAADGIAYAAVEYTLAPRATLDAIVDQARRSVAFLAANAGRLGFDSRRIHLVGHSAGAQPRLVGYRAKWDESSFEYRHTQRSFEFSGEDRGLLTELARMARDCGRAFTLRGYARVDFRVDQEGRPWVLEVNANPCLSPDAGFAAAAERGGLSYSQVIARIIADTQ